MRNITFALLALNGLAAIAAAPASAAPFDAGVLAEADHAAVQTVDYGDWRWHRWHRYEEWRRYEAWRHHRWHRWHDEY